MTNLVGRQEAQIVIPPPIRGMNSFDPPHRLPEGQGVDNWNVEIDEVLGINKRKGYTPFNTTVITRYNGGTIKQITGAMVYFSGTALTASFCKTSDVFYVPGNSSTVYWQIASNVGTATISLAAAYTQTVTASTYIIAPKEVGALFNYKYSTTQKLLAFAGSDGFAATAGSLGTFSAISAGLTDYQAVHGTIFQDVFYFCNGYEFKSYNGSTIGSISGSPPISDPKYICTYTIGNANYLVIAGSNTAAYKSAFTTSEVNSVSTWPTTNLVYVGDRDGTTITGVIQNPNGIVIFKENSIYVYSGIPGSGTLRKVVDDVGCVAPYSIVANKGSVYFIGRRGGKLGAYRFDGLPIVQCLSQSIEPTFALLNQSNADKYFGEIYEDKYVIASRSSAGTYNDRHLICYVERPFQYLNNYYFPWCRGDLGISGLVNQVISGTSYLFGGSAVNGFVYWHDTGNADDITDNIAGDSAAISAYADSHWFDLGNNSVRKELLSAFIDATQSGDWNLVFSLYKDFQSVGSDDYNVNLGSTVTTWAEVVYGVTPWQSAVDKAIIEVVIRYPAIAKHFRYRWANANASEPFTVYPVTSKYKVENR